LVGGAVGCGGAVCVPVFNCAVRPLAGLIVAMGAGGTAYAMRITLEGTLTLGALISGDVDIGGNG
jgi:hypothetical protein